MAEEGTIHFSKAIINLLDGLLVYSQLCWTRWRWIILYCGERWGILTEVGLSASCVHAQRDASNISHQDTLFCLDTIYSILSHKFAALVLSILIPLSWAVYKIMNALDLITFSPEKSFCFIDEASRSIWTTTTKTFILNSDSHPG